MRIFDEDDFFDQSELSRGYISKNSKNDTMGLGLKFSSDNNLTKKLHNEDSFRLQNMDPFASRVKSLKPMSIIFNSILSKSQ